MKRFIVTYALALLVWAVPAHAQFLQKVAPEQAGFSSRRLARMDSVIQSTIDQNQMAGAIALIARDGKAVHFKTYGMADKEAGKPMSQDAIFRIASMSKALTTTAVMILYEEGRFLLSDPVSKYIPEFSGSVVAVPPPAGSPDSVRYVTVKAHHPITIKNLLTHTAGLTYGDGPAYEVYKKNDLTGWYFADNNETIGESIRRLARLPLQGQPGEVYQYGYSTDVLGYLVEVVSGMPLDRFMETRIFKPLKMNDTGFYLPQEKINRFTPVYGIQDGKLVKVESPETSDYVRGPRKAFSGGAGILSTANDYGRFLQMLLNGGELEGVRILSPKTIDLMTADHVGQLYSGGKDGFGLGFWVIDDLGEHGELGSVGSFGWGSAYYPIYWVDPKERMFAMILTQLMPSGGLTLQNRFFNLTYQAMVK